MTTPKCSIIGLLWGNSMGYHDDVTKWKHFSRYWPFVREIHWSTANPLCDGNSPVSGEFFSHRPVIGSYDLPPNRRLSKQSKFVELRRYRAHYNVTAMIPKKDQCWRKCFHAMTSSSNVGKWRKTKLWSDIRRQLANLFGWLRHPKQEIVNIARMFSPIVSRAGVFVVQRINSQQIAWGLGWKCTRICLVISARHQPLKY